MNTTPRRIIVAVACAICAGLFTGCTSTYYKITQLNGNVYELERISLFQKLDVRVKTTDGFEITYTNDGGVEVTQRVIESAVTAAIKAGGLAK